MVVTPVIAIFVSWMKMKTSVEIWSPGSGVNLRAHENKDGCGGRHLLLACHPPLLHIHHGLKMATLLMRQTKLKKEVVWTL